VALRARHRRTGDTNVTERRFGPDRPGRVLWRVAQRAVCSRARPLFHRNRRKGKGTLVANIKSQIKRNRTNEAARLRNKSTKSALKTSVRKFREAADAGDAVAAAELAKDATRALDKAAAKGVIHKNQAANRKSAISSRAAELATSA
jgi:small subunit ribosomal protein S20